MCFSKYDSLEVGPLLRHRFSKSHTAHTSCLWQLFEELVFFYYVLLNSLVFSQTYLIYIVKGKKVSFYYMAATSHLRWEVPKGKGRN